MIPTIAGLPPQQVFRALRSARDAVEDTRPIVVDGILADELARALRADGDWAAVRVGGGPERALCYIRVLGATVTPNDVEALRVADRLGVPRIAVLTAAGTGDVIPYVPATDVVTCRQGEGFPVGEIGSAMASVLGHEAVAAAARLPAVRASVVHALVARASLLAGILGAAPWIRSAHFPSMTLTQARLVLDVAAADGHDLEGRERRIELAAVTGAGLAWRALGRALGRSLPRAVAGFTTGYVATRVVGSAAHRRFEHHA